MLFRVSCHPNQIILKLPKSHLRIFLSFFLLLVVVLLLLLLLMFFLYCFFNSITYMLLLLVLLLSRCWCWCWCGALLLLLVLLIYWWWYCSDYINVDVLLLELVALVLLWCLFFAGIDVGVANIILSQHRLLLNTYYFAISTFKYLFTKI